MRRSLAALAAVLFLTACSGSEDPDPVETSIAAETSAEATEAPTEEPGLTVGGAAVLSVASDVSSYDYDVTGIRAETIDGVDHVLAEVTITVTAGELDFVHGWSPWLTPTLESGGTEYEQTGYGTPDMFDGTYAAGDTATGTIGFEAPPEAAETGVYRLEVISLAESQIHEWTY